MIPYDQVERARVRFHAMAHAYVSREQVGAL